MNKPNVPTPYDVAETVGHKRKARAAALAILIVSAIATVNVLLDTDYSAWLGKGAADYDVIVKSALTFAGTMVGLICAWHAFWYLWDKYSPLENDRYADFTTLLTMHPELEKFCRQVIEDKRMFTSNDLGIMIRYSREMSRWQCSKWRESRLDSKTHPLLDEARQVQAKSATTDLIAKLMQSQK